jgi:hypothetical protein
LVTTKKGQTTYKTNNISTAVQAPAVQNIQPNPAWIVPPIELHQVQEATGKLVSVDSV